MPIPFEDYNFLRLLLEKGIINDGWYFFLLVSVIAIPVILLYSIKGNLFTKSISFTFFMFYFYELWFVMWKPLNIYRIADGQKWFLIALFIAIPLRFIPLRKWIKKSWVINFHKILLFYSLGFILTVTLPLIGTYLFVTTIGPDIISMGSVQRGGSRFVYHAGEWLFLAGPALYMGRLLAGRSATFLGAIVLPLSSALSFLLVIHYLNGVRVLWDLANTNFKDFESDYLYGEENRRIQDQMYENLSQYELVADTNIWLHGLEEMQTLREVYNQYFCVPLVVWEEIDGLKEHHDSDISYLARQGRNFILNCIEQGHAELIMEKPIQSVKKHNLNRTNDNLILMTAHDLQKQDRNIAFTTADKGPYMIAKKLGVPSFLHEFE